ncbi:MAG: ribosome-binding factor A [Micavibrio sp.]|nr:ribosome-binding factor A [Micavibrio sp.]|tara:strand:+ start:1796 stop:2212 length:417 start_codon:yes stop_codon:yes gene_type:complete
MKRKTSSKEPTQRQLRVGEQLKQIIAQTMLRGHFSHRDLLDASQVTVSEVRVSPDLKNATAYVMTLGGANIDTILPALNDEARTFQKEINRQSNMKFTPRLSFKVDHTFDEVQRINTLLNEVKSERNRSDADENDKNE